jgi:hypothetical protein
MGLVIAKYIGFILILCLMVYIKGLQDGSDKD